MYEKVSSSLNFVEREKKTEKFWEENDIFRKSIKLREGGETQGDGAGTGGNNNGIDGTEGVDESGNSVLGVIQQTGQIAGLNVAEDQSGTDCHGDTAEFPN